MIPSYNTFAKKKYWKKNVYSFSVLCKLNISPCDLQVIVHTKKNWSRDLEQINNESAYK